MAGTPTTIDEVETRLRERRYIGDRGLATSIFLALKLEKPLFIEGEAGVGKTEAAKVMAGVLGARLIRLQCYEGIDLAHAVYEWNYPRQLLHIRLMGEGEDRRAAEREIFSSEFLLRRPLLDAIDNDDATPPVLLIDEIDRSDEEFEAFLLELLSDFQVSIPEIGTIKAKRAPFVIITSNRTREVHDALKRRCLYHWIDYPDLEKEVEIVRARAPEAADGLAREVAGLVQGLRTMDLYKVPGVAETLDWARSLAALGATRIDTGLVAATMGAALKYQEDLERVRAEVPALLPRLGAFARLLHDAGVEAGPRRLTDATRALGYVDLAQQADFRAALRSVFVGRKEDIPIFEAAFDIFWAPPDPRISAGMIPGRSRSLPLSPERANAWAAALGMNRSAMDREQETKEYAASSSGYSAEELLRNKDFDQMTWQERGQVRRMLQESPWRVAERHTRRLRPARAGRIDLRRSARHAIHSSGELISLFHRRPRVRRRPVVLIWEGG